MRDEMALDISGRDEVDPRDWDYDPDPQELQEDWDEKRGIYKDE